MRIIRLSKRQRWTAHLRHEPSGRTMDLTFSVDYPEEDNLAIAAIKAFHRNYPFEHWKKRNEDPQKEGWVFQKPAFTYGH